MNVFSWFQRKEVERQAFVAAQQRQAMQSSQLCYRGVRYSTIKVESR